MKDIRKQNIDWETKIKECKASGMSIDQWCELNGVSKSALKYHSITKKEKVKVNDVPETISFIPLNVKPAVIAASSVDLIIRDGIHITIGYDVDLDLVKKIVRYYYD